MEAIKVQDRLKEHERKFENVDQEIALIKQEQEAFRGEMVSLQKGLGNVQTGQAEIAKTQKEMEVTLLKEGQANRELGRDTKEITKRLLDHVLTKDKKESEAEEEKEKEQARSTAEIRKMKWELAGKLSVAVFGTGGICYILIDLISK